MSKAKFLNSKYEKNLALANAVPSSSFNARLQINDERKDANDPDRYLKKAENGNMYFVAYFKKFNAKRGEQSKIYPRTLFVESGIGNELLLDMQAEQIDIDDAGNMDEEWKGRWVNVPYDGVYTVSFVGRDKEKHETTRDSQGTFLFCDETVSSESQRLIKRIADDKDFELGETYWVEESDEVADDFAASQLGK